MDLSGPVPHFNLVRSGPVQYHSLPNIRAGDRKLLQVKSRMWALLLKNQILLWLVSLSGININHMKL